MNPELPRRSTRQRSSIQEVIEHAHHPLLPPEILGAAQIAMPELGIATVYRNIKILLESGRIQAVDLPGEPTRYESARRDHHHHFSCRLCNRVFDIPGCPVRASGLAPEGFVVERHDLTLYGTCADCVAEPG